MGRNMMLRDTGEHFYQVSSRLDVIKGSQVVNCVFMCCARAVHPHRDFRDFLAVQNTTSRSGMAMLTTYEQIYQSKEIKNFYQISLRFLKICIQPKSAYFVKKWRQMDINGDKR